MDTELKSCTNCIYYLKPAKEAAACDRCAVGWTEWQPIEATMNTKATDTQVGGSHYKGLTIQPAEYCHRNALGFCESNIVKYITRWRDKGGVQDLDKVIHYVQLIKQFEGL